MHIQCLMACYKHLVTDFVFIIPMITGSLQQTGPHRSVPGQTHRVHPYRSDGRTRRDSQPGLLSMQ